MSFNRLMVKQIAVYPYYTIQLGQKKKKKKGRSIEKTNWINFQGITPRGNKKSKMFHNMLFHFFNIF